MTIFKSANKFTRIVCIILAICMLSAIPAVKTEAAVVEKGIDVSKWQGPINWQAVAQSGVSFAFIRVGNTKKGIDEYFYYNMLAAQQAGIFALICLEQFGIKNIIIGAILIQVLF